LASLPRQWDYIVDDNHIMVELRKLREAVPEDDSGPTELSKEEVAIERYCQWADQALEAHYGRGTISPFALPDGLSYKPHTRVDLPVPAESSAFVERYASTDPERPPRICILLGGSGASRSEGRDGGPTPYGNRMYPEISSWLKIIDAIRDEWPAATVYLTGVRKSIDGRPSAGRYADEEIDRVLRSGQHVVDCYDIGLWNQIALVEMCDVFISPSTGFSWLAPSVGTPTLIIAGGDWPDYFFNDVPFYSLLPDNPDYPYAGKLQSDYSTSRIPCMRPQNLDRKIPEIVEATRLLLDTDFTYEAACARHQENISRANVQRAYIPTPTSDYLANF
jgi:hypothetical protein